MKIFLLLLGALPAFFATHLSGSCEGFLLTTETPIYKTPNEKDPQKAKTVQPKDAVLLPAPGLPGSEPNMLVLWAELWFKNAGCHFISSYAPLKKISIEYKDGMSWKEGFVPDDAGVKFTYEPSFNRQITSRGAAMNVLDPDSFEKAATRKRDEIKVNKLKQEMTGNLESAPTPQSAPVAASAPQSTSPAISTPKPSSDNYDFRKSRWGMTVAEVKSSEKGNILHEKPDLVIYAGTVDKYNCHIGYIFAAGKLVRAKYIFTDEHINKNNFLDDFDSVKTILTGKYGAPKSDDTFWSDDLYKDDPDNWGMAVSAGHMTKFTKYETDSTAIILALTGENFEVSFGIEYSSKVLRSLEEEKDKKKNDADF
jgi:hypothetical protein